MRLSLPLVLAALVAVSACTSEEPSAGTGSDATVAPPSDAAADATALPDDSGVPPSDASAADSAADSGTPADAAGDRDSGPVDGAPSGDAAPAGDASTPADSGPSASDAGPGPTDALAGIDALPPPDSGSADAGTLFDATFTFDIGVRPDATPPGDGGPNGADAGNACTSNSQCTAAGEVCGRVLVENNTIVTRCGPANPSPPANGVGGACMSDGQCSTNLCLDGIADECTQVCSNSATDCPGGFTCAAYQYTPGNVWVPTCGRSCADDDDCAISPGNVCSTTTFPTAAGPYELAQVCQAAAGAVPLGGACTTPDDCRSGICFTTSRLQAGCAACGAGEVCQCSGGGQPPCAGGAQPDCVLRACTALCDDAADCASGGALSRCAPGINLRLPDGQTRAISACSRP